jgi:hypothetical protein
MPGINAMFLGTAMYKSKLVPRWIPTLGVSGAPLLLTSAMASIFAGTGQVSALAFFLALPIPTWEFSLGCYLTFKSSRRRPPDRADRALTSRRAAQPLRAAAREGSPAAVRPAHVPFAGRRHARSFPGRLTL